ncbi:unnamed protein product [Sphagnum tenellum]
MYIEEGSFPCGSTIPYPIFSLLLIPLSVKTMMYILLHLWGKGRQKERHKHKDKKKKDKAGDLNGEAHDSQWSSKLQRTDLVNNSLHKEKQNGRVQSESHPSAAFEQPFGKGETWDGRKALVLPLKTHSEPKAEVDRDAEEPMVWAKAIYLPVVDIYALPYVVPY